MPRGAVWRAMLELVIEFDGKGHICLGEEGGER